MNSGETRNSIYLHLSSCIDGYAGPDDACDVFQYFENNIVYEFRMFHSNATQRKMVTKYWNIGLT